MKKLLFIIMIALTGGAFSSCTDLTTDLTIDTSTRLIYFVDNPYSVQTTKYSFNWAADMEYHTLDYQVAYSGFVLDVPVKLRVVQTNFAAANVTAESALFQFGVPGVTWQEEVYEIPAGEKSTVISIKFIKDPYHVEPSTTQLKYSSWNTIFKVELLNKEEVDGKWIGTTEIHVNEIPIR